MIFTDSCLWRYSFENWTFEECALDVTTNSGSLIGIRDRKEMQGMESLIPVEWVNGPVIRIGDSYLVYSSYRGCSEAKKLISKAMREDITVLQNRAVDLYKRMVFLDNDI